MSWGLGGVLKSAIKKGLRRVQAKYTDSKDIREAVSVAPAGVDSAPVKGDMTLWCRSSSNNQYNIGYIVDGQLAQAGEVRLYARSSSGGVVYNVWLRASGEVLIGPSNTPAAYIDNLVKYTPLDVALQGQAATINANLAAIATAINAILPGAYVPVPVVLVTTAAKAVTIKTI